MNLIRPEILAAKLQRIRNLEMPDIDAQLKDFPRLLEALWFIEAMGRRPGGLPALVQEMIKQFPQRFGCVSMRGSKWRAGAPPCAVEQCLPVWQYHAGCGNQWFPQEYQDWLVAFISDTTTAEQLRGLRGKEQQEFQAGWRRYNFDYFTQHYQRQARDRMPALLKDWCEEPSQAFKGASWCPDLRELLFEFMDYYEGEASRSLAQTEVTRIVFDQLDFAHSQKVPVPIVGDTRFGKTKSVSTWCEMRPGRARLVTVPDTGREREFFAAHADAFGIQYQDSTTAAALKRTVEFVSRQSGLFLIYDEAHFLIPTNYTKTTPPRRLNWVRCQIVDRELGCAFFATPQDYSQTLAQYVKATGHNMEQWLGRLAPTVALPAELSREDLKAVARIHFPDLSEELRALIAARAMQSEGYLKNMEFAAKRARYLAQKKNREVTLEDVDQAIEQMLPTSTRAKAPPSGENSGQRSAAAPQSGRTAPAAPLRENRPPASTPHREISPALAEN